MPVGSFGFRQAGSKSPFFSWCSGRGYKGAAALRKICTAQPVFPKKAFKSCWAECLFFIRFGTGRQAAFFGKRTKIIYVFLSLLYEKTAFMTKKTAFLV